MQPKLRSSALFAACYALQDHKQKYRARPAIVHTKVSLLLIHQSRKNTFSHTVIIIVPINYFLNLSLGFQKYVYVTKMKNKYFLK